MKNYSSVIQTRVGFRRLAMSARLSTSRGQGSRAVTREPCLADLPYADNRSMGSDIVSQSLSKQDKMENSEEGRSTTTSSPLDADNLKDSDDEQAGGGRLMPSSRA